MLGNGLKHRHLRVSLRQQGVLPTLYWAAFGYLRPNRFVILARDLPAGAAAPPPSDVTCEIWPAPLLQAWRAGRPGLSPDYFRDEIDGVGLCAVALRGDDVAGLVWIYGLGDPSRMFRLGPGEAELNYGYVRPAFRGHRLFHRLLTFACEWLGRQRYTTAYAAVLGENLPSLRSFRGAGFAEIGGIRHFLGYRPRARVPRVAGSTP